MNAPALPVVMSIDDERIDQVLISRVLERSGLVGEVLTFRMADEALEFLRQKDAPEVDAIFLDINMPRMSGLQFLDAAVAELGEDFAKCVVIMLSTSLNPADQEHAQSFEIVKEFFNKPVSKEHIGQVAEIVRAIDADRAEAK